MAKYGHIQRHGNNNALKSGDTIPYLGRDLKLVKRQSNGDVGSVSLERNSLIVSLMVGSNRLDLLLERWYRMQAAQLIDEKVKRLSTRIGLT